MLVRCFNIHYRARSPIWLDHFGYFWCVFSHFLENLHHDLETPTNRKLFIFLIFFFHEVLPRIPTKPSSVNQRLSLIDWNILLQNPAPLNHQPQKYGPSVQCVWTTLSILLDHVGISSGTHFVFTAGNHFVNIDNWWLSVIKKCLPYP